MQGASTPSPRWLTAGQAAARLGWSPLTVKAACDRGDFTHQYTPGKHLRVLEADVDARVRQAADSGPEAA